MIRRNPTLIPMSDLDVQDVRDHVEKQNEMIRAKQQMIERMKRVAEGPLDEDGVNLLMQLRDVITANAKDKERERRLGLTTGQSEQGSSSSS